jgi:heme/copper-type cytochrome/quinol oxidase subunit 3
MSTAMRNRTTATWLFLIAAVVGCVLPLRYLVRFLLTEGLNAPLFFQQLFQNDVSAFFAMDVIVSSLTFWLFVFIEGRRRRMKALWAYVLCTLLVGASFALPLFLYFRERHE